MARVLQKPKKSKMRHTALKVRKYYFDKKWLFFVHDGIWTQNHGIEHIKTQNPSLWFELFIMVQFLVSILRNFASGLHWNYLPLKLFYILSTVMCILILDVLSQLYYHYTYTVLFFGYWGFDVMLQIEIITNRFIVWTTLCSLLCDIFFLSSLLLYPLCDNHK